MTDRPARDEGALGSPSVSVVVPSWNGRGLLERFLPGVERAARARSAETLLVDDGSSDGSEAWVARNLPGVRILRSDANRGFIEAAARGVEAARGEVVVLLNNDVEVEEGFFDAALGHFADPGVFAVSLRSLGDDGRSFREGAKFAAWRLGFLRVEHDLGPRHRGIAHPAPTLYAVGGHAAYRRDRFLALGGFSSLYRPFYFEDLDLSVRGWRSGWKVLYEPRSTVVHRFRSVAGTIRTRFSIDAVRRIRARNRLLFHWRHLEGAGVWGLHALALAGRLPFALALGRPEGGAFFDAWARRGEVLAARAADRSLPLPLREAIAPVAAPRGGDRALEGR